MSNFRRRLMMARKQDLYIPLEYIESTNASLQTKKNWIDTGVKVAHDLKFEIKYEALRYGDNPMFGGRDNNQLNQLTISYYDLEKFIIRWYNASPNNCPAGGYNQLNTKYKMLMSKNGLYINDTPIYESFNQTEFDASDLPGNITLFAFNNFTTNSPITFGQYRIYHCKIWKADKLIRDLIPVMRKSDGAICMYDLVTRKFFENQGTEDFAYSVKEVS